MNVEVDGVSIAIDGHDIVTDVSIKFESGQFHGIVGPNGCGKSTLLRSIYRALRPRAGHVTFNGDDLWKSLSARDAARQRAIVAQDSSLDLDFSVHDVVSMGRSPHKRLLERDNRNDHTIVEDALHSVDMHWAQHRMFATLSGGERQRALLARALTQQAAILVLDEPTNHLDVKAQVELLDVVKQLRLTTIAALHDLDQAAAICDAVSVIRSGCVVASGDPLEVLTPSLIREVFGVESHIGTHPLTGRPQISVAPIVKPVDETTKGQ